MSCGSPLHSTIKLLTSSGATTSVNIWTLQSDQLGKVWCKNIMLCSTLLDSARLYSSLLNLHFFSWQTQKMYYLCTYHATKWRGTKWVSHWMHGGCRGSKLGMHRGWRGRALVWGWHVVRWGHGTGHTSRTHVTGHTCPCSHSITVHFLKRLQHFSSERIVLFPGFCTEFTIPRLNVFFLHWDRSLGLQKKRKKCFYISYR